MRKYKVNRDQPVKLPSKEAIEKYKDFSRLTHEYDNVVKRPKVPLYKDKRMFFIILFVALMALLLAQSSKEEEAIEQGDSVEQVED